jgi:hypothetical protein
MSSIPLIIVPSWWLEEEEEDGPTPSQVYHIVGEMLVSPLPGAMHLTAVLVVTMGRAELSGLIPQPVVVVEEEASAEEVERIILEMENQLC